LAYNAVCRVEQGKTPAVTAGGQEHFPNLSDMVRAGNSLFRQGPCACRIVQRIEAMSFLKKLFGGGSAKAADAPGQSESYKDFLIKATPYKEGSQFQLCGVIEKEIAGEVKQHRYVRADKFGSMDEAIGFTLSKGRLIIDEQGERIFQ
jgi:hypothetical protein